MTLHTAKQFSVDSHGAYLVSLTDGEGKPILFERTEIDGKRRGGAHVCLPYFGADAAGVLPQHGFGRDVEWEIEVLSDREISCFYEEMDGEFPTGFRARMLYSLDQEGNSFHTALLVMNTFRRKGPFAVSPGFHPYFAVDPKDVRFNGQKIDLADFEPYKDFPDMMEMTIESGGRTITVWSQNLLHMVVWTDMKGDYLCVEPTLSGHSFDSTKGSGVVLQTSESESFSYNISWV